MCMCNVDVVVLHVCMLTRPPRGKGLCQVAGLLSLCTRVWVLLEAGCVFSALSATVTGGVLWTYHGMVCPSVSCAFGFMSPDDFVCD